MNASRLATRRARARAGVLGAVALGFAIVAGGLSGTLGWTSHAERDAYASAVSDASAEEAAVWFRTPLADDPEAQRAAAERLLDAQFGDDVRVARSVRADAVPNASGQRVLVAAIEADAATAAARVEGRWPGKSGETAVHAVAAERLGLDLGDVVRIPPTEDTGGATLEVVGLVAPDPGDPTWAGWPAALDGGADDASGPLFVVETAVGAVDADPQVAWAIAPRADRLDAAVAARLEAAVAGLDDAIDRAEGVDGGGVETGGGLPVLLDDLATGSAAVAAVVPVPVLLLVIVGLAAVARLAGLLATSRDAETALLRARGLSIRQLALLALVESVIVAVLGAVVGVGLAAAVAAVAGGADAAAAVLAAVLPWPALVVAGGAVVSVVVAARRARHAGAAGVRSGRAARAATTGGAVLVVAAAALAVWQLQRTGSPLLATADGGTAVEPLAALAPALALIAGGILVLLAAAPVAHLVERMSRRTPGLAPSLPARRVARRLGVLASAVLLVAVASGAVVVAAAYGTGWARLSTVATETGSGADLRFRVDAADAPAAVAATAAADGVDRATAVLRVEVEVGGDPVDLVAMPADAVADVLPDVGGAIDPRSVADRLGREDQASALDLPGDATGIAVAFDLSDLRDRVRDELRTTAWLRDAAGVIVRVPLGSEPDGGEPDGGDPADTRRTAALPAGTAPWTLLAVDAEIPPALVAAGGGTFGGVRLDAIVATTPGGEVEIDRPDAALLLTRDEPLARHPLAPGVADAVPVPAVVNAALADRLGLAEGDLIDVRVAGTGRTAAVEVAGVVPVVPGTAGALALLADGDALAEHFLATSNGALPPGEVVASGAIDLDDVRAGLTAAGVDATGLRTPAPGAVERVAAAAVPAWWIAVAGTLGLAALAVGAIALASSEARRREHAVLLALGQSTRAQSSADAAELGWLLGGALAAGTLVGAIVAALVVGAFVRAAVPGGDDLGAVALGVDPVVIAAVTAAFAVLLAGTTAAVTARTARRSAADAGTVLR